MTKQATCQERIQEHYESRMEDFRLFASLDDLENPNDQGDIGSFYDYGLNLAVETSEDEYGEDCILGARLLLSCGGPEDSFFYCHKAQTWTYSFKDWFDGAEMPVPCQSDLDVLDQLYGDHVEMLINSDQH